MRPWDLSRRMKRTAVLAAFCVACTTATTTGLNTALAQQLAPNNSPEAGLATAPKTDPRAGPLDPVSRPDEDLLLVEARLNNLILADSLAAYITGSSIVLPLRDLADVLQFAIGVDPTSGTADGWFMDENRLFSLNLSRGEVILEGRPQTFNPGLVELHREDIFVDIRLLSRWFPIDIEFDLSRLILEITSREPLPIERQLAREDFRERVFSKQDRGDQALPRGNIPFKAFGLPMVDVDAEWTVNQDSKYDIDNQVRYNALATGDFAYMNMEMFVSGANRNKISDARLRFDRKDPDGRAIGDLSGPVDLTEVSLGDVYTPQVSLVSRTQLGRGLSVSSLPLGTPSEFDRITLDGDLSLGWEVELYRNEVLIDFKTATNDGRYRFEDVPLLFGINILRLVFYGPQGQTREELRQFRVGADLVKPGEMDFRFVANQHDRPLAMRNNGANDVLEGKRRLFAEVLAGVSRNFSVAANAIELPLDGKSEKYGSASARFSFGDIFGRVDAISQVGQGWAMRTSAQTSLAGISFIGEHNLYRNFFSEQVADTADALDWDSQLRIDGAIPVSILPRMPFSLTTDYERKESKAWNLRVASRLSAALGLASLTNNLTFQKTHNKDGSNNQVDGSFLIGGRVSDVRLRGSVGYDLLPTKKITNVALTGDYTLNPVYQLQAGVTRTLGSSRETLFTGGVNARYDQAALGFELDVSSNEEITGRFTVSFGLAADPNDGSVKMSRRNLADRGAVAARVFLDNDDNGRFSEGDEPLEGVGFRADRAGADGVTDAEGHVLLTGLEPYSETGIRVDRGTLSDPFWVASPEGYRVVPRPGSTGGFDFPVVTTGEIDGTVFRVWPDGPGEAAGVVVQLVRPDGTFVRELKTAYDGFFLFNFVRPGDYILRVDPGQLQQLGLSADTQYEITIKGDGTIVTGQDIVLREAVLAEAEPTETVESEERSPEISALADPNPISEALPEADREQPPAPRAEPVAPVTEAPLDAPDRDTAFAEPGLGPYQVHLAAYTSESAAYGAWERLTTRIPSVFGDLSSSVERINLSDGRAVYNLYAMPFDTLDQAESLCIRYRARLNDAWCKPVSILDESAPLALAEGFERALEDGRIALPDPKEPRPRPSTKRLLPDWVAPRAKPDEPERSEQQPLEPSAMLQPSETAPTDVDAAREALRARPAEPSPEIGNQPGLQEPSLPPFDLELPAGVNLRTIELPNGDLILRLEGLITRDAAGWERFCAETAEGTASTFCKDGLPLDLPQMVPKGPQQGTELPLKPGIQPEDRPNSTPKSPGGDRLGDAGSAPYVLGSGPDPPVREENSRDPPPGIRPARTRLPELGQAWIMPG